MYIMLILKRKKQKDFDNEINHLTSVFYFLYNHFIFMLLTLKDKYAF